MAEPIARHKVLNHTVTFFMAIPPVNETHQ